MDTGNVTALLHQIGQGDPEAWSRLLPLVYEELREIARRRVGNDAGATLGSTALVHEAFPRMVQPASPSFEDRKHFFAVAALAMHQILVDYARGGRSRNRERRFGLDAPVPAIDYAIRRCRCAARVGSLRTRSGKVET